MEPKFSGTVGQIFIFCLWMPIIEVISLGLATPFLLCVLMRWVCDNTVISGKRCKFKGAVGDLYEGWIKWTIISVFTIGVYSFWSVRNTIRWVVDNIEIL